MPGTRHFMETVTSLPTEVIYAGQGFVDRYKRTMLGVAVPALALFLAPPSLDTVTIVGLSLFYCYVIGFSKLSRILRRHDVRLWCQLYLSLLFGLAVVVFLRFFDLNHWLIHEVGYLPDGEVKSIYGMVAFAPLWAAYFDSFKRVELAYYKSKGYCYVGLLTNADGL